MHRMVHRGGILQEVSNYQADQDLHSHPVPYMLVTSNLSMTSNFLFGFVDLLPDLLDSRYFRSLRLRSSSGSIADLSRTELSELRLGRLSRSLLFN